MTKRAVILVGPLQVKTAVSYITALESIGMVMTLREPTRTTGQNERFHAIVGDIAKSGLTWGGKKRDAAAWKVLLVSGHATATKEGSDMVPGLEGEFVNLRESTALMSVKRGSSLIEYATAFAVQNGVMLHDPVPEGWA